MTKEEVVALMVKSVMDDNRSLCERGGMSKEETEASIEKSTPTMGLLMSNLYDRLKKENLIA